MLMSLDVPEEDLCRGYARAGQDGNTNTNSNVLDNVRITTPIGVKFE